MKKGCVLCVLSLPDKRLIDSSMIFKSNLTLIYIGMEIVVNSLFNAVILNDLF